LIGYRAVFGPHGKATAFAGKYTVVITGTTNAAEGPLGASYGTVTISSNGTLAFAGSLADGTPVSQTVVISTNGEWPLYLDLYGGKGSLLGWNQISNGAISSYFTLSWINGGNASKSAALAGGFTNQNVVLTGSSYNPALQPVTGFSSGLLSITNAPWNKEFTNALAITANNLPAILTGDITHLKLSINKANGTVSGSFANPFSLAQTIDYKGVIIQNQTNVQGYFIIDGSSGAVLIDNQ
jgi:hypothetical protein